MPEFEYAGIQMNNPVELALHVMGGKWKMPILWRLKDRMWRYGELRRDLKKIDVKPGMPLQQSRRGFSAKYVSKGKISMCNYCK